MIPKVEVHIRVPLEKEVPLTPLIKDPKKLVEKPEFPELVEVNLPSFFFFRKSLSVF